MVVLHFFIPYSFRRFGGRIALIQESANCPHTGEGELQFAPTRVFSERSQISCKYV